MFLSLIQSDLTEHLELGSTYPHRTLLAPHTLYCIVYNENLFKFELKFIESSYEFGNDEIKQIQTNYDNKQKAYLNKLVLTKAQLEEQDDIKYDE